MTAEQQAAQLHGRAIRWRARGKLPQALAACLRAARLFVKSAGDDSPDAAHAEVEAAEIAELRGDLTGAARLLQTAGARLATRVRRPGLAGDVRDLHLRISLGAARVDQLRGRHGAAERTLRATLARARRNPESGRAHEGAALNALGVLRKAQGRYAEALALYRRALPLLRGRRGATSDLATIYHNLAGSEQARGRLRVARAHARRGLRMRRRVLGHDDPAVLADEAALAVILDGLGQRAEAERLYRRVLAYSRRRFGPRSYEVSVNLGNLGALYRQSGDLARAEKLLRQAVAIEERLLGPRHPELALSLHNLAVVLAERGKKREALAGERRAERIFALTVDSRHPHAVACRRALKALGLESA
jgi:tetratricopeptide (TPR) repeat protein